MHEQVGEGLLDTDRVKLIDMLCSYLNVQFEDTAQGLINSTTVAIFKLWPEKEESVEGYHNYFFNLSDKMYDMKFFME